MNKIQQTLIAITIVGAFYSSVAYAADTTVTCDSGGCSMSGDSPSFDENNIYPGWSKTKTVKAVNDFDEEREFMLQIEKFDLPSNDKLGEVLEVTIKKEGASSNLFGPELLQELDDKDEFTLSSIDSGDSTTYEIKIKMLSSAGNEYQAANTNFDIVFGFDTIPADEEGDEGGDEGGGGGTDEGGGETLGASTFGFGALTTPAGSQGQILGEQTPESTQSTKTNEGEVAGTADIGCKDGFWWIYVLVGQFLMSLMFMFLFKPSGFWGSMIYFLFGLGAGFVMYVFLCTKWLAIFAIPVFVIVLSIDLVRRSRSTNYY